MCAGADGARGRALLFPPSLRSIPPAFTPALIRYTPLKQIEGMPPALEYDPVRCKQPKCGAVLNPYW